MTEWKNINEAIAAKTQKGGVNDFTFHISVKEGTLSVEISAGFDPLDLALSVIAACTKDEEVAVRMMNISDVIHRTATTLLKNDPDTNLKWLDGFTSFMAEDEEVTKADA